MIKFTYLAQPTQIGLQLDQGRTVGNQLKQSTHAAFKWNS